MDENSDSAGPAASDGSVELLEALQRKRRTNIAIATAAAVTLLWGVLWLVLGDKERGLSPISKAYYFGRLFAVPLFALMVVGVVSILPGRNWLRASVAYLVIMVPGLATVRTTFNLIDGQKEADRTGDTARSGSPYERRVHRREAVLKYRQQKQKCDGLMASISAKRPLDATGLSDQARIRHNQRLLAEASDAFWQLALHFESAYANGRSADAAYVAKTKELFQARSQQLRVTGELLAWLHDHSGQWELADGQIAPTTDAAAEQLPTLLERIATATKRAESLLAEADALAASAQSKNAGTPP